MTFKFVNYMTVSLLMNSVLTRLSVFALLVELDLPLITTNSLMEDALLLTLVVDSSPKDIPSVLLVSLNALSSAGNSEEWLRNARLTMSSIAFNTTSDSEVPVSSLCTVV